MVIYPQMLSAILTAALYLLISFLQIRRTRSETANGVMTIVALSALALLLHAYSALSVIQTPAGINLGFFKISSVICWIINLTLLLYALRRPVLNLLIILFPLAALVVLVSVFAQGSPSSEQGLSAGMWLHIGSSVLAYAVLTISFIQAAATSALDHQLRHRHTSGLVQILPPMQLMEAMLFEFLWLGLALLTLAIASGMVFLDDIFAQHLVHKTVLTIAAWCLFALLLWGHKQRGWRAQTAARLTFVGFGVLMLGYFGSKLVLEVILQRA